MIWKELFESHILQRGYTYYCEGVVDNLEVTKDKICADVEGTYDYEVEISLAGGEVTDMYCSCPYAEEGCYCKHMAAVLFAWTEEERLEEEGANEEAEPDLFQKAHTVNAYKKKTEAIRELVEEADIPIVKEYLVSALAENEKLLMRFYNVVKNPSAGGDISHYIRQINAIADRYMGRERFIDYHRARGFVSELEDILDEDVRRLIDEEQYKNAFEVMNYIFVLIGDVDMDDSDGGTGMLANQIYQLWLELLEKEDIDGKQEMFHWFTKHLDGSVIDYLEEYIEEIITEEFGEKEFVQQKRDFFEEMLEKSEKEKDEWSSRYGIEKWAGRYLEFLEYLKCSASEIEEFCRKYWENPTVRSYYIDKCIKKKDYKTALEVLDESIELDRGYRGLVLDYVRKKKEIYRRQGDREAYVKLLWELLLKLDAGDMETYRELKKQYTQEEWEKKREEVFKKLPNHIDLDEFYKEEKLYDRLIEVVMNSSSLYTLEHYAGILKKDYPEQILIKYEEAVSRMAASVSGRQVYQEIVSLLRKMKKMKGGTKVVEKLAAEWKVRYKNRPAMMDELGKL